MRETPSPFSFVTFGQHCRPLSFASRHHPPLTSPFSRFAFHRKYRFLFFYDDASHSEGRRPPNSKSLAIPSFLSFDSRPNFGISHFSSLLRAGLFFSHSLQKTMVSSFLECSPSKDSSIWFPPKALYSHDYPPVLPVSPLSPAASLPVQALFSLFFCCLSKLLVSWLKDVFVLRLFTGSRVHAPVLLRSYPPFPPNVTSFVYLRCL